MKLLENFEIVRGQDVTLELHLFDQFGNPEDIVGASAVVNIFENVGQPAPDLSINALTEPGGMKGVLRASMTSIQTAALVKETYIVRGIVSIGGLDHASQNHYLRVRS